MKYAEDSTKRLEQQSGAEALQKGLVALRLEEAKAFAKTADQSVKEPL